MPAHDFDKTLQEKAHNLRIEPSPRVWEGISEELHRKRRRRGAAWIFTAAAIVSGITVLTIGHFQNNLVTGKGDQPANGRIVNRTDAQQLPVTETGTQDIPASGATKSSNTKTTAIEHNTTLSRNNFKSAPTKSPLPSGNGKQPEKDLLQQPFRLRASTEIAPSPDFLLVQDQVASRGIYPAIVPEPDFGSTIANVYAPVKKQGDNALDTKLEISRKLSVPDKWHLAVQAGAGTSSLVSGGLQQYNSFANEYNASVSIPAGIAGIQHRPSDIKSGPAFTAGIQVSYNLSKKVSVGTGLQYAYNSNRLKLGSPIDSTVAIYNDRLQMVSSQTAYKAAGNSGNRFYNEYHFIALPLDFTWNFDQKQRWYLNAGASVGILAGVNAVHYNNTAGVYYRNNDVFNRWQTAINTGVQYKISSRNSAPVWIGPYARYHLSALDNSLSDKHLLVVGIGARMQLK